MNALVAAPAVGATTRPITVMVVDDSAVVRGLISRQIDAEPGLCVVASASNGEMALVELRRHSVDVIVLDIEMPVMDGLTALPLILALQPTVKVVIASTLSRRNAEISLRALQLGASDYLAKPEASLVTADDFRRELIAKVRALGGASEGAGLSASSPAPAPPPRFAAARASVSRPAVIAIGGSTGAPPVLVRLFAALKGRVTQPILLTQHMPPTFTGLLAEQLSRSGGRPCAEGHDGDTVLPGRAYVAPGGWHMTVVASGSQRTIRLNQDAPENFCRPAVDPMFRSLAEAYGPGVLAIVLTGMGVDGAVGCTAIAKAGGRFAVQDQASSVVWGMPGAAVRTGLAERIIPVDAIAAFIIEAAEAA